MAKDPREYGYEGEMAMSQLKGIMNHAKQLHDMLEPNTDLPEWVQSKITKAYDYIQTAADYMATEMKEEVQIDELSKKTLGSYIGKADVSGFEARMKASKDPKARRKAQNRTFGLERAVKKFHEDAPVNAAGAGNVAGLGVGPQGEPGVHMKRRKKTVLASFRRFTKA